MSTRGSRPVLATDAPAWGMVQDARPHEKQRPFPARPIEAEWKQAEIDRRNRIQYSALRSLEQSHLPPRMQHYAENQFADKQKRAAAQSPQSARH
eukprot:4322625-Prymnesium_polylepis.1